MTTESPSPQASAEADRDYTTGIVPLEERKGPLFMGLLWITMVTGLSTLSLGVGFYQKGLTLLQTLQGCVGGALMLLAYTSGAAYLGARTGQTYAVLTRSIFGRLGSYVVSAIMVLISLGWFGFQAEFLAKLLDPLLGFGGHLLLPTLVCALLMGVTNYFGFTGVAGYARFVAAPVLLVLVLVTVFKAFGSAPAELLWGPAHAPVTTSVLAASGVVMGFGIWGNEPDFWRFGRPRFEEPVLPLGIAMALGLVLFPAAGWALAALGGVSDEGSAAAFLTRFALGGMTLLAVAVFAIAQVSNNDPNLYEAVNAFENVTQWPRRPVVVLLWLVGIATAVMLSRLADALFLVSGITSVLVPTATVVMLAEVFWVPRLFGLQRPLDRVPTWQETAWANWPALCALSVGALVGVYTNGTFPGFGPGFVGIPPLQAWGAALAVYLLSGALLKRHSALFGLSERSKEAPEA